MNNFFDWLIDRIFNAAFVCFLIYLPIGCAVLGPDRNL